jgi:antirestriction protein ArdC
MTYKQATELGGQVRRGETGTTIVYASKITREENNEETGETRARSVPFLRAYVVFNVEQIEGLPDSYYPAQGVRYEAQTVDAAERLFAATGADVRHGGSRAFYCPAGDFVQMPDAERFKTATTYTATKAHELVHWTGHETRCGRTFGRRFGDDAYAFEELVAELGAAFLCAELGLFNEVREDHAAYMAAWLRVLKQDKRAIFTAASAAQKAVDCIRLAGTAGTNEPAHVAKEREPLVACSA